MPERERSVLVAIVGGDLSPTAFADACEALDRHDARLVLLHIAPAAVAVRRRPPGPTLWRTLAERVEPQRVFVETAVGDPRRAVAAEAARFHPVEIVRDRPPRRRHRRVPC